MFCSGGNSGAADEEAMDDRPPNGTNPRAPKGGPMGVAPSLDSYVLLFQ
jgi:hypothetical protein